MMLQLLFPLLMPQEQLQELLLQVQHQVEQQVTQQLVDKIYKTQVNKQRLMLQEMVVLIQLPQLHLTVSTIK